MKIFKKLSIEFNLMFQTFLFLLIYLILPDFALVVGIIVVAAVVVVLFVIVCVVVPVVGSDVVVA